MWSTVVLDTAVWSSQLSASNLLQASAVCCGSQWTSTGTQAPFSAMFTSFYINICVGLDVFCCLSNGKWDISTREKQLTVGSRTQKRRGNTKQNLYRFFLTYHPLAPNYPPHGSTAQKCYPVRLSVVRMLQLQQSSLAFWLCSSSRKRRYIVK